MVGLLALLLELLDVSVEGVDLLPPGLERGQELAGRECGALVEGRTQEDTHVCPVRLPEAPAENQELLRIPRHTLYTRLGGIALTYWRSVSTKLELTSEARHFVKQMQTIRNKMGACGQ